MKRGDIVIAILPSGGTFARYLGVDPHQRGHVVDIGGAPVIVRKSAIRRAPKVEVQS